MAYKDIETRRKHNREYIATIRAERKAQGLCIECGQPLLVPHIHCKLCLIKQNERHHINRAKYSARENCHNRTTSAEVLTHYGNGKLACVLCGYDSNILALSIDHINGGGCKHRKLLKKSGTKFHSWLKRQGYPEGYRTLCMNCQIETESNNYVL